MTLGFGGQLSSRKGEVQLLLQIASLLALQVISSFILNFAH